MDAQAAVTLLSVHPNVDSRKITLWGISFGGLTSVFLQAIDRRVACIAVVASGVAPPPNSPEAKAEAATLSEADKKARAAQAADLRKVTEEERRRSVLTGKIEMIPRDRIMRMDERSKQRSEQQRTSLASGPAVTQVPDTFLSDTSTFPPDLLRAVAPLCHHGVFVSSAADMVLPPSHATQLYDRAGGPKKMVVIAKEKDMSHFDMYEAANVRYIVRHEALPSWNAWFAEAEAKGKKSKM